MNIEISNILILIKTNLKHFFLILFKSIETDLLFFELRFYF